MPPSKTCAFPPSPQRREQQFVLLRVLKVTRRACCTPDFFLFLSFFLCPTTSLCLSFPLIVTSSPVLSPIPVLPSKPHSNSLYSPLFISLLPTPFRTCFSQASLPLLTTRSPFQEQPKTFPSPLLTPCYSLSFYILSISCPAILSPCPIQFSFSYPPLPNSLLHSPSLLPPLHSSTPNPHSLPLSHYSIHPSLPLLNTLFSAPSTL